MDKYFWKSWWLQVCKIEHCIYFTTYYCQPSRNQRVPFMILESETLRKSIISCWPESYQPTRISMGNQVRSELIDLHCVWLAWLSSNSSCTVYSCLNSNHLANSNQNLIWYSYIESESYSQAKSLVHCTLKIIFVCECTIFNCYLFIFLAYFFSQVWGNVIGRFTFSICVCMCMRSSDKINVLFIKISEYF